MTMFDTSYHAAAAAAALSIALLAATTPARAEAKQAGANWNASTFAAACVASPRCSGGNIGGNNVQGVITNDGSTTTVTCTSTRCVYDTRPTGGSPARVALKDKRLGIEGLLGQSQMAPPQQRKLEVGQRSLGAERISASRIDVPKPVRVETPKISAPVVSGKDTQVLR